MTLPSFLYNLELEKLEQCLENYILGSGLQPLPNWTDRESHGMLWYEKHQSSSSSKFAHWLPELSSGFFDAVTADGTVDADFASSVRESIRAMKRQASCMIYEEPNLASTNPQWPPVSV
uniref:Uncharacterized protein n=1 Tax=Rhodosorus marinus TaxID=101924 RepID=A0A7S0BJ70_9RHOD|mmetsp:Transcript_17358/g.24885  ORF Transcript_17358/g.24885 Transcript_17358/m.24885 type:complete len:119 (+) Transcript_17358:560-916(+)